MPGKQVKSWPMYHALRKKGFSKRSAARITNARKGKKNPRTRRGRRKRK